MVFVTAFWRAGALILALAVAGCGEGDAGTPSDPPSVRVPALVGSSLGEARETLAGSDLDSDRPLTLELGETPAPTDTVRRQHPAPGESVPVGWSVDLYTKCVIEPCRAGQLRLSVGGSPDLSGGGALIGFTIEHRGGPACELTSPLEVAVTDSAGQPVPSVDPFVREIPYRLADRGVVSGEIGWGSMCEGRERVRLVASIAGQTAVGRSLPPACQVGTSGLVPFRQGFGWLTAVHQATLIE